MEYKSNITIASNIYPRASRFEESDPRFVANVRGVPALRALQARLFGTGDVRLNEVQRRELRAGVACSHAYNYLQEMTHGPVMGKDGIKWLCRCENVDCSGYSACMPVPLIRQARADDAAPSSDSENAGLLGDIDRLFIRPETDEILDEKLYKIHAEMADMGEAGDIFETDEISETEAELAPKPIYDAVPFLANEYVRVDSASIVEADIGARILVNAGPGTGKTHAVVERLAHIIRSGAAKLGQTLVLCYTNAARDVILGRLGAMGLGEEARQMVICTLDSLAWWNLVEKTGDDLFALGFDGCIKKFNDEFDAAEWSDFEYVIVDELQDIVNERARMTLNVLKAIKCGYLLLGDRCQAIYDYDRGGAFRLDSTEFYHELENLSPETLKRCELVGNRRQSDALSELSEGLRSALLTLAPKAINEYFQEKLSSLKRNKFLPRKFSDLPSQSTTAILTRSNGEAEWISARLHKENVRHSLLRSACARPSLKRWIADVFWDYREARIGREAFIERYCIRVEANADNAFGAYEALAKSISGEDGAPEYIELAKLNKALRLGRNLSPPLTNAACAELTVSTIHKAKGREFDHVYLMGDFSPSDGNADEARVFYVGATRPKTQLGALIPYKLYVTKPTRMNRRLRTAYRRGKYGKPGQKYCSHIVVGLRQDIDAHSFVEGDLTHALQIQRRLASSVKLNDAVELIKDGETYSVMHDGDIIGALSYEATLDIFSAIKSVAAWSDLPCRMTEIYIENIVTVIPERYPSGVDAMFRESGFWLGVELTGFARAYWGRTRNNTT